MNGDCRSQLDLLDCIHDFVQAGANRELTKDQWTKFEQLLLENDEACRLYLQYVQETDFLQTILESMPEERFSSGGIICDEPQDSAISGIPFASLWHSTISFSSPNATFAYLLAAIIVGIGLSIMAVVPVSQATKVALHTPPAIERQQLIAPSPIVSKAENVGRITGMVDCKWYDAETPPTTNAQVSVGQKYTLASGLMEITYNMGAKVILQGPVTYEVKTNGGFLSIGKLTGKLEKQMVSDQEFASHQPQVTIRSSNSKSQIANPLFVVRTPNAIVTDLGTEFGVEVSKDGKTTSHVFRGSVELRVASADKTLKSNARVLHANESACVENAGNPIGGNRTIVFPSPVVSNSFVRAMPENVVRTFDLVDVVAGGNGYSGKRNASIDPTNGRRSDAIEFGDPTMEELFPLGDGKYHHTDETPLIDGVFIPDGSNGPVQVDSAGHCFADFPKTSNRSPLLLRAGGPLPTVRWSIPTVMRGIDYAKDGHGLLFMHPNKGITFDLDAIRKANRGWTIRKFLAVGGNIGIDSQADIWVLVDGVERFTRYRISPSDGIAAMSVPIRPNDRFLTLASTDGGDGVAGDWIMFGDPRLELTGRKVKQMSHESSVKEKGGP
jgi:hypothetical protein